MAAKKPAKEPEVVDAEALEDAGQPVDPIAYEQGRAAKRSSIAAEDCPHGGGAAKDAWLKGYGSI